MLEMLAEYFSGCVSYVRACFVKISSVSCLASAVCCPQTPPPPPPHTHTVNGCSHTHLPPATVFTRLAGAKLIGALSLQKDLNSICLQWLQFPGQPKSALFFQRLFFFFAYSSWRTIISFHYFVRIHLPSPPTIHHATEISVCEYMCVCVHMCVSWEHTHLFAFKPRCQTWSFYWTYARKTYACLFKDLSSWFHSMCITVGSKSISIWIICISTWI